jgi:hypothetical protein
VLMLQTARDPYGYMLSALQLQKLYIDRSVAADKLASGAVLCHTTSKCYKITYCVVTVVADKRCDEWRRLVTPAAGAHAIPQCSVVLLARAHVAAVQELQTAVAAACSSVGITVKW